MTRKFPFCDENTVDQRISGILTGFERGTNLHKKDSLYVVWNVFASRNKCHASSNRCLTSSNKKLLGAPGLTARSKKLLGTSATRNSARLAIRLEAQESKCLLRCLRLECKRSSQSS